MKNDDQDKWEIKNKQKEYKIEVKKENEEKNESKEN